MAISVETLVVACAVEPIAVAAYVERLRRAGVYRMLWPTHSSFVESGTVTKNSEIYDHGPTATCSASDQCT
ncbi:MAG: hypothetical protein MJD61_09515 [Proteobacteria bacterium]|nr:hypothetical protein [Pseudomonadota bacterium]